MEGNQRQSLGFGEKGYIYTYTNSGGKNHEWFLLHPQARYCVLWGWYSVEKEPIKDLPSGVEGRKLLWDEVGAGTRLRKSGEVPETITSTHQGSIGERLDLTLSVFSLGSRKGIPVYYFEDKNKNRFLWATKAKVLQLGETYSLRGTVKAHEEEKGGPITVLTRCALK